VEKWLERVDYTEPQVLVKRTGRAALPRSSEELLFSRTWRGQRLNGLSGL
jgi:hypothetical protein